jgi:hypothetical protein
VRDPAPPRRRRSGLTGVLGAAAGLAGALGLARPRRALAQEEVHTV